MRRSVILLALAALALGGALPPTSATTYYVQLIRGTDGDRPPVAGSPPVGARLARHFHSVFKWKHYWQIGSRELQVAAGQKARVSFDNGREVQIDLTRTKVRTVSAFHNGRVVTRTLCPRGDAMTLIGGDRDEGNAWFIVVRRDRPEI